MTVPGVVDPSVVRERVEQVRARIDVLGGGAVQIVAVTKSFGADAINAAADAGCDAVGENYAQELLEKMPLVVARIPVHFIGHIQSNKVRQLAPHVSLWQSVDRVSVVDEIAKRSGIAGSSVLIQVNTTGEPQKGGVPPEGVGALRGRAESRGLRVLGLMTMGPTNGDNGQTRAAFRLLRSLVDREGLPVCSMGMSDDYEIAVESGATMVRLGSLLFGPRRQP